MFENEIRRDVHAHGDREQGYWRSHLIASAARPERHVANGEVVRAIIGHAMEAMTHHYSHVGEDEKREAVARVFAIVKAGERVVSGVVDSGSTADPAISETEKLRDHAELCGGATQI